MKKTLKALIVVVFMSLMLLILTGCGNKLVASRKTETQGLNLEEKLEVKFKDDKVESAEWTYILENKDLAKTMADLFNISLEAAEEELKYEVSQNEKEVKLKLDSAAFARLLGEENGLNKDELKDVLEKMEYEVK